MNQEFKDALDDSPIIAAIKDNNGLKKCLTSSSSVIFILYGDICNISDIVDEVKKDIFEILDAGATCISSSNEEVWFL